MIRLALCITGEHDHRLVALSLLICLVGSAAVVQLFDRIRSAIGPSRLGWIALSAVGTGTMVWSTHFVAMMAYRPELPVVLDPWLTLASLGLAIVVAAPGLALASRGARSSRFAGGAIVGVAISAMHYLGMAAYRIDGILHWDGRFVAGSVVAASLFSALAFDRLGRPGRWTHVIGGGLLALAVAALHFTGMAAITVAVLDLRGGGLSSATQALLAITTAFASLLVLGCSAVSALIDGNTHHDTFRRLRRMALRDGLTDLPNRLAFHEEFGRRLAIADGYPHMAVVMLDLSRFKTVNDTYGHQAGDQLLIALAARFNDMLEPGEFIARLGGDEFAALVSYTDPAEKQHFLDRLGGVFAAPFAFERFSASVGANIGVSVAPQNGRDVDGLLAKADLAMYRAKSAHSDVPCVYEATMDDAVRDRRELAGDLRGAIAGGAFELHYQVQTSIATGDIAGYEALVRWRHPVRGLIPPNDFIHLAEEAGEIIPLSVWILRQACFEAALWPNRLPVAVNLSPLHLSDALLVETVRGALADSGLPPARLSLELTESAIICDRRFALAQLHALRDMGIGIALDDFGVGYSSLDVLRSFPFSRIKLDASFVAGIEHDGQAVSILRSVAALGATLGMPVLAEGIETPAQLAIVAREGCAAIQGYLIGRPARTLADPAVVRSAMQLAPRGIARTAAA